MVYRQRMLRLAGYYDGEIDGIAGKLTRAAEKAWDAEVARYKAMYDEVCIFDDRSEKNILTLLPRAQYAARGWYARARKVAAALGVKVKIICGTRTYAEQNALYAQGRTKKGDRVTNARGGYSWHNFGVAWDFGVFSEDGKKYYGEHEAYETLGQLARAFPELEWGGAWRHFKDEPHIQLNMFSSLTQARKVFQA